MHMTDHNRIKKTHLQPDAPFLDGRNHHRMWKPCLVVVIVDNINILVPTKIVYAFGPHSSLNKAHNSCIKSTGNFRIFARDVHLDLVGLDILPQI